MPNEKFESPVHLVDAPAVVPTPGVLMGCPLVADVLAGAARNLEATVEHLALVRA